MRQSSAWVSFPHLFCIAVGKDRGGGLVVASRREEVEVGGKGRGIF